MGYAREFKSLGNNVYAVMHRVAWPINGDVIITGEIPRLDIDLRSNGYAAWFFGTTSSGWSNELRIPLVQSYVASIMGTENWRSRLGSMIWLEPNTGRAGLRHPNLISLWRRHRISLEFSWDVHECSVFDRAHWSCRLAGRLGRRCPSVDDACFPFQVRGSSVLRTATKPSPSPVSTVGPGAPCPSMNGTCTSRP